MRSDFPRGAASARAGAKSPHPALGSRFWFFTEMAAGGAPGADQTSPWFTVDRQVRTTHLAELRLFSDDGACAAPTAYRLQAWRDREGAEVSKVSPQWANSVDRTTWTPATTSKPWAVSDLKPEREMRLVEVKVS